MRALWVERHSGHMFAPFVPFGRVTVNDDFGTHVGRRDRLWHYHRVRGAPPFAQPRPRIAEYGRKGAAAGQGALHRLRRLLVSKRLGDGQEDYHLDRGLHEDAQRVEGGGIWIVSYLTFSY